jgi:8-oxo-dGTP pyrophosphatase MutT (NUDIX family)
MRSDNFFSNERLIACLKNGRRPSYPTPSHAGQGRQAAVLIPMLQKNDGSYHLLFTRRTETVQDHKGQVSFPGGAVEPQDASIEAAALRETQEEIGVLSDDIRILATMPPFYTDRSNFHITPVVARLNWPVDLALEVAEVSRAFTIPMDWLADPTNYAVRTLEFGGRKFDGVIYYQRFDGELLWGITAHLAIEFLKMIDLHP